MFVDAVGDAFSFNSPHTGLLWALEGVAWSSQHAPLAIKLLARLVEMDPGGRLSNRPLGSLVDIFRAWLPQTSLPLERRIAVLDTHRRDHEEVAWKLLFALLPEHHGVGTYTHAPRFRAWKPETFHITYGERCEFEAAVAQRLIEAAEGNPQRWLEAVEHLDRFPPTQRATAVGHLRRLAESDRLSEDQREQLWGALDKMVRHHRSFPTAEWSLPTEELDTIGAAAEAFKPTDPVRAHGWLFDAHLPDIGDARAEYHEQEARVQEARAAAVADVVPAHRADGILQLAAEVEFPGAVGATAARNESEDLDEQALALLDDDDAKRARFAAGYSFERARRAGVSWVEGALTELAGRPLAQARLLQQVDDDLPSVWQRVAELGAKVEEAYWSEFITWGRGDFQFVNEAADHLLRFKRPIAALDLMALYLSKADRRVSSELIVEGLQQLVRLPTEHHERQRLSAYELGPLLDYLRDSDVDEEQLGVLEWQLLTAMGFDARSPVLQRRLARDRAFFVEILSLVYRPRGDDTERPDIPQHVATNAYRLLDEWRIVPGSTDRMGEINCERLDAWVETARELAHDAGREEVADVQIGKVLAHARSDEDETWPTLPVRNLIERLGNTELEEGFEIEIHNSRGPTSRGLLDGRAQERELVKKYDEQADRIRDGWPRTAAILTALARGYEREARRQDEETERFRQGMDR
jgi:hypothetical protein